MSAQIYDVGSIVDFWPDPQPSRAGGVPQAGAALVVVGRDMWVLRTELRRVVLVDGRYVVDDEWFQFEPGARCVAHGTERCDSCHRNPSTCMAPGETPGCGYYSETGMHWDTCPNRRRSDDPHGEAK